MADKTHKAKLSEDPERRPIYWPAGIAFDFLAIHLDDFVLAG
jgi:hypothetical protein